MRTRVLKTGCSVWRTSFAKTPTLTASTGARYVRAWFEKHPPTPKRFNRSKSKGYYRRNTRGIAWFRDNAKEYLGRMHEIKMILEANGHQVTMIREERVGYIVYEDEFQVVAEPFSETQTGAT